MKFKEFFTIWFIVLFLNQILLFNACFFLYCIVAALPHTGIISYILALLLKDEDSRVSSFDINNRYNRVYNNEYKDSFSKNSLEEILYQKTDIRHSAKEKLKNKNPLKEKGDAFERYIGKKFEEKNEIVIYNGFIRGYEDAGVDIISICKDRKTINLVQCKNWTRKTLTLDYIVDIYSKLSNFNFDFRCDDKDIVCEYLQSKEVINKLNSADILDDVYYNYNNYTIRKTLYISSDKVVDLKLGQELKMMKENIFRYKNMKIVIHSLG